VSIPREIEQFAAYLASITDEAERSRAMARVKLLAVESAPEEAFEPPIRTLGQYLADPIEVPPVLVDPYYVVRGGVNGTIGRAGKGKTVMNLNRLLRWAAGKPFFEGWHDSDGNPLMAPTDGPIKSLIIENEGAGGLFHRQVGIMTHADGYLTDEDRKLVKENVLVWGDGGYSGLKLDDPIKLNGVRRGVEKWEPDIVFIEPFRGLWNGDENSSTDMAIVVDAMVEIAADYKCAVIISHHERKSGVSEDGEKMSAGRGSTVLEGAVTVMENFESVKGGEARELTASKSRHGKAPNPVRMEWDPDAWWYKWVPTSDIEESLIAALRDNADEAMSVKDFQEATDEKAHKIRPILNQMAKDGKLKKMPSISDGGGSTGARYRLPTTESESFGGLSV
jgi:hypothetical protein